MSRWIYLAKLALTLFLPFMGVAASTWVPYSAQFKETISTTLPNGKQTTTVKVGEELRSGEGSTARFEVVEGHKISADIWLACGQAVSLNYGTKRALVSTREPPQHAFVPPDPPLGTMSLAGTKVTGYPIHMTDGTGSIWIDMVNEIAVKIEMHHNVNGVKHDYIRELLSVDLSAAVTESSMRVPDGFSISASSVGQSTCAASH